MKPEEYHHTTLRVQYPYTMLLGKRVDLDHTVVFADFTNETCLLSNLTWYTIRSMEHLAWQAAITIDVG